MKSLDVHLFLPLVFTLVSLDFLSFSLSLSVYLLSVCFFFALCLSLSLLILLYLFLSLSLSFRLRQSLYRPSPVSFVSPNSLESCDSTCGLLT